MLSVFKSKPDMWLIAGLGNPGDKYAGNRHNIGFMAVDRIADEYGFPTYRSKFQGAFAEGKIGEQKVVLLKPMTYMNESGVSVAQTAKFYKIKPDRIVILHDELDLPPGKMRVKDSGGTAGHNGLKSIKAHLGTDAFQRIRLGIGHPGDRDRVSPYVLSDFAKAEAEWVENLNNAVSHHISLVLEGRPEDFMTKVAAS